MTTIEAPARRVTKRREETRRRLLDAALAVFAREGFGRTSVEQVCDEAGYTRGAFYSNFASLDELFLAVWAERSQAMLADLAGALDSAEGSRVRSVRDVVDLVEAAVGIDEDWYRVTAEFTAHALRNSGLRDVMAAREEAIAATILPVLRAQLSRVGRRIRNSAALTHALIAVHDGTTVQCLLEPDSPEPRRRRRDLFHQVVLAYTTETTGGTP